MQTIEANILDYYQAQKKNLRQLKNTLVAYNLLEKDDTNRSNNRVTMKKLVGLVEDVFDTDVLAKNRMQNTVFARKAAAYVLKKHTSLSLKEIAPYIGVKDHTTVLYNVSTAIDLITTEEWYKNKIDEIENEIKKFNIFVQN
jgi:chromosomal replication initiator protein